MGADGFPWGEKTKCSLRTVKKKKSSLKNTVWFSLCPLYTSIWVALSPQDINAYNGEQPEETLPFPIIADKNRELAVKLGMLDPDERDKDGMPLTARVVSAWPGSFLCLAAPLCRAARFGTLWGAGLTSQGWVQELCCGKKLAQP